MSSCGQEDRVSLASYNELEQLHMQVLLNCYLAAFLYSLLKFLKSCQGGSTIAKGKGKRKRKGW